MSSADEKEPMPLPDDNKAAQQLVIEDVTARALVGFRKYGTLLRPMNGRDNLMDAYQEGLDLVVYLRNEIHRREIVEKKLQYMLANLERYLGDDYLGMSIETIMEMRDILKDALEGTDNVKKFQHPHPNK